RLGALLFTEPVVEGAQNGAFGALGIARLEARNEDAKPELVRSLALDRVEDDVIGRDREVVPGDGVREAELRLQRSDRPFGKRRSVVGNRMSERKERTIAVGRD